MTLTEFNELDIDAKAEAVWQGTFLADRKKEGFCVQLYSLPEFYAEVFYNAAANKITEIKLFTSVQQLGAYLA